VWGHPASITRSIYWQTWAILRYNPRGEKGKRVGRQMSVCLMFKLAAVALPIDANPFNHKFITLPCRNTVIVLKR
jgi:hypothetical protein